MLAFAAHFYTTYAIAQKSWNTHRRFHLLGLSPAAWITWRHPMDHVDSSPLRLLGLLGDHLWTNALAWDVLFSLLGLAYWGVIRRLNAKTMVQCAICPWWNKMYVAIKVARPNAPDGVARGGLRGGLRGGAARNDRYVEDEEEEEEEELSARATRARSRSSSRERSVLPPPDTSTRRRPGRPPKRASSRGASQQPEESQGRSKSRGKRTKGRSPSAKAVRSKSGSRSRKHKSASPPDLEDYWTRRREIERIRRLWEPQQDEPDSEELEQTFSTVPDDGMAHAEQAGLTLALYVLGGLGMASAGVFGAEELAW